MAKQHPKRTKTEDLYPMMCNACEGKPMKAYKRRMNVLGIRYPFHHGGYETITSAHPFEIEVLIQPVCRACEGKGTVLV